MLHSYKTRNFKDLTCNLLFDKYFELVNYDTLWIAISINIYIISYYSLKQPELLRMVEIELEEKEELKPSEQPKTDRLDQSRIRSLSASLNKVMNEECLYLDNQLTLKSLAEKVEASPNDVSWLLNEVYGQSFYDYVNSHRVEQFKHLVEKGEHQQKTILALAMEVGFNSKSTFNTFFKQQMDQTPSAYIRSKANLQAV